MVTTLGQAKIRSTKIMVVGSGQHEAAELVARMRRLGYEAVSFTRIAGVVNAVIDQRPDWLLVDVTSAVGDGSSLCELLRSAPPVAKLQMLLLGSSSADMRDLVLRSRAQGYLMKEPSVDGIAMKLDAFIRRRVPLIPLNERERLAELHSYNALNTSPDEDFDGLTRLASHICDTPVALMSIVDWDRNWFKSNVGFGRSETPRADTFCAHAIHGTDIFEVPDVNKDDRFVGGSAAGPAPSIRFYAGAPLVTSNQQVLGTLCVVDLIPRHLTEAQRSALRTLARLTMRLLDLKKKSVAPS